MLPGWDKAQDIRNGGAETPPPLPKPDVGAAIEARSDSLVIERLLLKKGVTVSKLGAMAERIAAKKEAHDRKADEWAQRLDLLDRREPAAFAIGDAVLDERETDLADMERSMRALSNLPNVVSGKS